MVVAAVIAQISKDPIRSPEELDRALDAVRSKSLELLDAGKEVRLT